MIVRIFTEYVASQDENDSGGWFIFAKVQGDSPKRDIDYMWRRLEEVYHITEELPEAMQEDRWNVITRSLGTICMMCVARDPRPWVYIYDIDHKIKVENGEIPEANRYFIGDYILPEEKSIIEKKIADTLSKDHIQMLQEKFNGA